MQELGVGRLNNGACDLPESDMERGTGNAMTLPHSHTRESPEAFMTLSHAYSSDIMCLDKLSSLLCHGGARLNLGRDMTLSRAGTAFWKVRRFGMTLSHADNLVLAGILAEPTSRRGAGILMTLSHAALTAQLQLRQ